MTLFAQGPRAITVRPRVLSAVRQCGRIQPDKPGFARRTLECPRCQRRIIEVIELEKAAS